MGIVMVSVMAGWLTLFSPPPAEAEAIRGKPLTLTLVSDEGAREASVTVE